jgi:hypothetical protein
MAGVQQLTQLLQLLVIGSFRLQDTAKAKGF